MKNHRKDLYVAMGLLITFILLTVMVCFVDVQHIGPRGSAVGFATVNGYFHDLTGVHMMLYTITDWMGLVPVAVGLVFAVLGLTQWISRKYIWKVDFSILILGAYYLVVLAVYLLFEEVVINRRPVLIEGYLEASYPSSTTMLAMCVMPPAAIQLRRRVKNKPVRLCLESLIYIFVVFMVVGRLLSGVHWLSDIVGGALVSSGLVLMYRFVCSLESTVK